MNLSRLNIAVTLCLLCFSAAAISPAQDTKGANSADTAAIRQAVAAYSGAFNRHDAQATAMTFAEDADFTNMRGDSRHGRKEIEQNFATLYSGVLKSAHRTDSITNIRFLTPRIAEVSANWEMTGTRAADGTENPLRKGLIDWVMTKQNGHWLITVFHEADFPK